MQIISKLLNSQLKNCAVFNANSNYSLYSKNFELSKQGIHEYK